MISNKMILKDTLNVLNDGYYSVDGKVVKLILDKNDMEDINVFMPEDIEKIKNLKFVQQCGNNITEFTCTNKDSFEVAIERYNKLLNIKKESEKILVLNFANPVRPGGGVRLGACAQEEDLCRRSSLLLSLENKDAAGYYLYHETHDKYLSSNSIMVTPKVEIFKDRRGEYLNRTFIVSVLTCAAPVKFRLPKNITVEEYEKIFYYRLISILTISAYLGYKHLILGAFGCGEFGNDARLVAKLFYKAFQQFNHDGLGINDFFDSIDFAILSNSEKDYNYNQFKKMF